MLPPIPSKDAWDDEMTFLRVFLHLSADATVPGSRKLRPDQIHKRASQSTNRYSGLCLLGIYSYGRNLVNCPIFMRPGVGGALIPLGIGARRKVESQVLEKYCRPVFSKFAFGQPLARRSPARFESGREFRSSPARFRITQFDVGAILGR